MRHDGGYRYQFRDTTMSLTNVLLFWILIALVVLVIVEAVRG